MGREEQNGRDKTPKKLDQEKGRLLFLIQFFATVSKEQGFFCPSLITWGVAEFYNWFLYFIQKTELSEISLFLSFHFTGKSFIYHEASEAEAPWALYSPCLSQSLVLSVSKKAFSLHTPHRTWGSSQRWNWFRTFPSTSMGRKNDCTKTNGIPESETPQKSYAILIFTNKRMMIVNQSHESTVLNTVLRLSFII